MERSEGKAGRRKKKKKEKGMIRRERKHEATEKKKKDVMMKGQGGEGFCPPVWKSQGPDTSVVTQDEQLGKSMSQHLPYSSQKWWLIW